MDDLSGLMLSASDSLRTIAVAPLASIVIIAGASPARPQSEIAVSKEAAYSKAEAFFRARIGCGARGGIRDDGSRWAIDARVGYAGELDPNPIFVDKRTGGVTWKSSELDPMADRTPMEEF